MLSDSHPDVIICTRSKHDPRCDLQHAWDDPWPSKIYSDDARWVAVTR
jgi:hypothetical protein